MRFLDSAHTSVALVSYSRRWSHTPFRNSVGRGAVDDLTPSLSACLLDIRGSTMPL
jgi:hypothetical protein